MKDLPKAGISPVLADWKERSGGTVAQAGKGQAGTQSSCSSLGQDRQEITATPEISEYAIYINMKNVILSSQGAVSSIVSFTQ